MLLHQWALASQLGKGFQFHGSSSLLGMSKRYRPRFLSKVFTATNSNHVIGIQMLCPSLQNLNCQASSNSQRAAHSKCSISSINHGGCEQVAAPSVVKIPDISSAKIARQVIVSHGPEGFSFPQELNVLRPHLSSIFDQISYLILQHRI